MFVYFLTVLFSIVIIFGIHRGIQYMRDTYTVKKVKDVVKFQNEKYDKILQELASKPPNPLPPIKEDDLTEIDGATMQTDLEDFLKSLL
jgi:hypothetical protein